MIEIAGIKLSSVVCDSFGKTGRAILDALAQGAVDASTIIKVAKGSLRRKTVELHAATFRESAGLVGDASACLRRH